MKKIIFILFLFFLLYACYYIYNITEDNKLNVVLIGDTIADNPYLDNYPNINKINKDFINSDYHLKDLLNIIKYNQELDIDNKTESIHKLLKESDIVIISIGMNDIYYKLNDNTKEIYSYVNDIINNYNIILKEISKYDNKYVFILGYYNITNKNNDIFTYVNYKIKNIVNNYHYTYLDLNKILYNNKNYYQKSNVFYLNNAGYEQIYKLIVENLKKSWYNIKCIYYYDLY